jgi:hypothetical protein
MDRTVLLNDVDEHDGTTYAEPLAGLRVSWGSILAGALAMITVTGILWALAAAIVFTATNATIASLKGTLIALWTCAMVTTLAGAFVGGWLAAYLPGNKNRVIGAVHGALAAALAFILMSAVWIGSAAGIARTATEATVTAATGAIEGVGSATSGEAALDRKARNFLMSLGYTNAEAGAMVHDAQIAVQRSLRGGAPPTTGASAHDVARTFIDWGAGLTWSWFGTWLLSCILAIAGGLISVGQLRPRFRARPIETPVVTPPPVEQPA